MNHIDLKNFQDIGFISIADFEKVVETKVCVLDVLIATSVLLPIGHFS